MGVIDKIKNLHKQTLLKLKDIKRVVIADEAGVNNEKYLSRAKTLKQLKKKVLKPTVTSDLPENVTSGVPIEFNSTTTTGDYGGTLVYASITIDRYSDVTFEYYEENQDPKGYIEFPESDGEYIFGIKGSGYPLMNYTSKFRITFNKDGKYELKTELIEDSTSTVLATDSKTVNVSLAKAKKSKSFKL